MCSSKVQRPRQKSQASQTKRRRRSTSCNQQSHGHHSQGKSVGASTIAEMHHRLVSQQSTACRRNLNGQVEWPNLWVERIASDDRTARHIMRQLPAQKNYQTKKHMARSLSPWRYAVRTHGIRSKWTAADHGLFVIITKSLAESPHFRFTFFLWSTSATDGQSSLASTQPTQSQQPKPSTKIGSAATLDHWSAQQW
jgi:hypothetical protein